MGRRAMRVRAGVGGLLWVIFLGIVLCAGQATAKPYAYVPNEGSNDVTVFDTATDTVVATIPVGLNPIRLAVTPDGRKVYVACIAADRVFVIDTASNTVTTQIAVQDGPAEVLASPDGTRIYVPNSGEGGGVGQSVSVIDVATDTVITNIPAGVNCRAIAWVQNSSGRYVYVLNQGAGNVTVINHDTLTSPGNIPTGGGPRRICVSPDGTRAYTANFQANSVTAIDTVRRRAVATISVGDGPRGIAITPNGQEVYVANLNTNYVSVIRASDNRVINNITVGGGCWTVVINSSSTRAYVVSSGDRNCYIIDIPAKTVIDTAPIGVGSFWAKFNADESKLYVTNPDSGPPGSVSVIDTASNTTIKTITTGDQPWIVDIQSADASIFVPSIRSAVPTQIPRGCTVPVTVFGSNFIAGVTASITPSVSGLSISSVQFYAATNVLVTVKATATAALSTSGFRVTNPNGNSDTDSSLFTVTGVPNPQITRTVPNTFSAGTNWTVNVYGSGLQDNATLAITPANAGATITGVTVVNYTNVTLTLGLAATANTGTFGFRLTNPSGPSTTNATLFSITAGPPVLTTVSPNVINAGSATAMNLFGAGLLNGASLTVRPANSGISLSGATVNNSTNMTVTMTVAATANTGSFGFAVTNPDGKSSTNTALYSILPSLPPVPRGVVPTNVVAGSATAMSLFGSNFQNGATLTLTPANTGVALSGITFANATNLNLTVTVTTNAPRTTHGFIVFNPDGKRGTNASLFAISAPPPALVRVTPTNITAGLNAGMTVLGSNFQSGVSLVLSPANAGATLSAVTFVNGTNLNLTVNTTTAAALGAHGFIATNPDGKSVTNAGLFEITAPLPTLSNAVPNSITAGDAVAVNVSGTFFQTNATLTLTPADAGITLGPVTFLNASNLAVTVTTTTGAALGAHGFVVTNPDGKSATNSALLSITAPRPLLVAGEPTDITAGTSVPVTVFGSFFQSGATLALSPANAGATLGSVTFVNSTNLSVMVNTTTGATLGNEGFIVTNPDGKSATNSALFAITAPRPVLSSAAPTDITAGDAVSLDAFGQFFQPGVVVSLVPANADVSLSPVTFVNATNLNLTVTTTANAAQGAHGFVVTNPDGKSATNAALFAISAPRPTLAGAEPTLLTNGTGIAMSVFGNHFQPGAALVVSPANPGVDLTGLTVVNATNLTFNLAAATNAATGVHGFIVMNPDSKSATNAALFTVVDAPPVPPTLSHAAPFTVAASKTVAMNVYGTGFQPGATLTLDPPDTEVTLTGTTVVAETNISVTVAVTSNATVGVRGFIVTNPDTLSATNAAMFAVLPVPLPQPGLLASTPAVIVAGTTASLSIDATNLQPGATLVLDPPDAGIVLSNLVIVSDVNLTVDIAVAGDAALGAYGFIVTNPDDESSTNAALFAVVAPPPALVDVSPTNVVAGALTAMNVFGTGFQSNATLTIEPPNAGVTLTNLVVVNATNATVELDVTPTAALGAHGFIVVNGDGQSVTNAALFELLPAPAPILTAAEPGNPAVGASLPMNVYGTGFQAGATLVLEPANAEISLTGITIVNATNITLTVDVTTNSTLGAHGFILTNADGQTATNATLFTLRAQPPALLSAAPAAAVAGNTTAMSLVGSNFQTGATVALEPANAGVTLDNVVVAGEASITFDAIIASNATTGAHGFVVTNPDGQAVTNAALFEILPPPPTLLSAEPTNVVAGTSVPVSLFGDWFVTGASVVMVPGNAGVGITGVTVLNSTNITLTMSVATNATLGVHGFVVTNPTGQAATNATLLVIDPAPPAPPPALTSASPAQAVAGVTTALNVSGSDFQAGATLVLEPANAGVTLANVVVAGPSNITLDVIVAGNATTGVHGFVVTNPDTQSATNAALFEILPPPPAFTEAQPTNVVAGTSGVMSLFGERFVAGATLELIPANAGVGINDVTVLGDTNITLSMIVATNATPGTHGFIVTNPNGQAGTNASLFTISPPPVPPPVLDSADPALVAAGTNIAMMVLGDFFQNGGTLTPYPASGLVVSNVTILPETSIMFTLNVASNAELGARGFIMTNPDGKSGTNAALFTIVAPPPPPPSFTDVTASAGVTIANATSRGNPVWGDLNNDAALDFIVPTGGTNLSVFLSRGDGTFSNFTSRTGIVPAAATVDSRRWFGLALADYDDDGNLDLFITEDTRPPNGGAKLDMLWRGYGTGEFTNMASVAGVTNPTGRGAAAFWVDYDADGCLDLFVQNFNTPDALYAGVGCGATTNRAAAAGLNAPSPATNVSWADYDADGLPDLCLTGAGTNDVLFLNRGDGTFSNATVTAGLAARNAGQGIAWGDYNNDGYVDLFIGRGFDSNTTNLNVASTLYRNNGDGTFSDVSAAAGIVATNNNWAGAWGDYDNDGRLDLFVTAAGTPGAAGNANHLYRNNGDGTFSDLAGGAGVAGLDNATFHLGAAWADYNNDGFLDLLVKNGVGAVAQGIQLYRNQGNSHRYLKLVLHSTTGNRGALGALVQVTAGELAQVRQLTGGGGGELFSQGSTPLHFGLGTNATAIVDVLWPNGVTESFGVLPANATVILVQGRAGQPALPAPQVFSVSPTNVVPGARSTLTVDGEDFQAGATAVITPTGTGARVDRVDFVDDTTLSLEVIVDGSATLGGRGLLVTNPDGQSGAAAPLFTVATVPPPVINTVTPTTVPRGQQRVLTVTGSGFQAGLTATIPNPRGVTVTQVTVVNSTTLEVTVSVTANAQRTTRDLRVQNPDGQQTTKTAAFTVN